MQITQDRFRIEMLPAPAPRFFGLFDLFTRSQRQVCITFSPSNEVITLTEPHETKANNIIRELGCRLSGDHLNRLVYYLEIRGEETPLDQVVVNLNIAERTYISRQTELRELARFSADEVQLVIPAHNSPRVVNPDVGSQTSTNKHTVNQQRLNDIEYQSENIPEKYLCFLSREVMDNPVQLGSEDQVCDRSSLMLYKNGTKNPFNRQPMNIDQLTVLVALQQEIDQYVDSLVQQHTNRPRP